MPEGESERETIRTENYRGFSSELRAKYSLTNVKDT